MRSVYPKVFAVVIVILLNCSATAQPRDDVGNRTTVPQDTTKKPRYINVDTTKPVPVETKTLVRSVLRLKNIHTNPDALAICRILNPDIYLRDSTLSNHTIILPNLPDPPSDIRRELRDNFKRELKPDENINRQFRLSALRFDTLANIFFSKRFTSISSARYDTIRKYLPALAIYTSQAAQEVKRTSQKTVATINKEVETLNNLLEKSISSEQVSNSELAKIYSLMFDINILSYMINDKKLELDSSLAVNNTENKSIYLVASYSLKAEATSGDDDPKKFNIYIFRKSLLETTGDKNPEMDTYSVSYVIPALADDEAEWTTIPKPASTTSTSFPPARFKFAIKDTRTGISHSATVDLYDAQKDPDEKWTIWDLINPHPVYRLMFLIP